ncbi:uncharacterized protein LOC5508744 [Nematostella vectensis]|uniref:uncharacterized protein LOC5508744 n=1 Tax=Nematostella vectensis TaxID=45351 RepID=UPI0020771271|nr:uncharacterized protein LOC5508744 [Nematostella vectensis]
MIIHLVCKVHIHFDNMVTWYPLALWLVSLVLYAHAGKPFTEVLHYNGFPGMDTNSSLASFSPKIFFVRNNLDGNIEFRESSNVSLSVYISGNDYKDRGRVKVFYKLLANNTVVDIQVYHEPESFQWQLVGGIAAAGLALIVACAVFTCCWRRHGRGRYESDSEKTRSRSQLIEDRLQVFEVPSQTDETPTPVSQQVKKKEKLQFASKIKKTHEKKKEKNVAKESHKQTLTEEEHGSIIQDKLQRKEIKYEKLKEGKSRGEVTGVDRRRQNTATASGLLMLSIISVAMAASTLSIPRARIVINVPSRLVRPGSKIFFSEEHHGRLIVSRDWRGKLDVFEQFAVSQATSSLDTLAPCSFSCHFACDVNTNQCICYYGYQMSDNKCKDIDECKTGRSECHQNATCTNTVGSYRCICNEGFWGDGITCRPCTINEPCPENFYEAAKCTRKRDRLCVACSKKCDKTEYQKFPCGMTFDRLCVDISKPLTRAKKGNTSEIIQTRLGAKVLVPGSANVLMENRLRVNRTQETLEIRDTSTPTITLSRETGFLVDIQLLESHLTPIYKDYDGRNGDENPLIKSITGVNEIRTRYCRYPAPNYYTLTNKVHSGRQTMVTSELCRESNINLCPKYASAGELYLYRTVNRRCHLAENNAICGTPNNCSLLETDNRLYCTNYVEVLEDLFGKSKDQFKDTSLYVFSSAECRLAFRTCLECRKENCSKCVEGSMDKVDSCSCCFKNCIEPCEFFYAGNCGAKREPKKCARGETSEFKLDPSYSGNLRLHFNCYLEHEEPTSLYTIRYRIREARGRFSSRWVRITIDSTRIGKIKRNDQSAGTNFLDFIEITHDNNINLGPEIFLKANRNDTRKEFQYQVSDMSYIGGPPLGRGSHSRKIQPVTPFSVHVSNGFWQDRGTCNKLNSWKKYLRNDFSSIATSEVKHLGNGRFAEIRYKIGNATYPPTLTFKISDKMPILKFISNEETFKNDKHFRSSINRTNTSWMITLKGRLSACPSVIGLKVIDEIDRVKVVESDLLFLCPEQKFNFKIDIPRKGLDDKERLFSVYLTDSLQEYKLQIAVVDKMTRNARSGLKGKGTDKRRDPWKVLTPLFVITGCVVMGLVVLIVYAQITAPKGPEMRRAWGGYVWVKQKSDSKIPKDPNRLKRRHMILVIFVVTVRTVYSLVFNFSMALALLTLLHAKNLEIIGDYRSFVQSKVNQGRSMALRMDQFREQEIKSSVDQSNDVQRSCDYYLEVQRKWLYYNMSCALQGNNIKMFNKLTRKIIERVTDEVDILEKKVKGTIHSFSESTKQRVRNLKEDIELYGRRVYDNNWFGLPRTAYNFKGNYKNKRRKRGISENFMQITALSHMAEQQHNRRIERALRVSSRMRRSFSSNKFIDFLDYVGAVDKNGLADLEKNINEKLDELKAGFADFKAAMASGRPPTHPLSTALLCPLRYMSQSAKTGLKSSISSICSFQGYQGEVHCASVNISAFCSSEDADELFGENSTDSSKDSQRIFFEETDGESPKNISDNGSIITSDQCGRHYNVEQGDSFEEHIDTKKEEKLKREGKLKNSANSYHAEIFATTRSAVLYVLAIVDILLLVYRSMKTYQIAMRLMHGFEEYVEHDAYEFQEPSNTERVRNILQRIFDFLAIILIQFITAVKGLQKKIVRTNLIPMIIVIAIAAAGFYFAIVIIFNVVNVTVIEELGGFRIISARLDADLYFTNHALSDHIKFLNTLDMKMYKKSMKRTLDGYKAVLENFNEAQRKRFQEFNKRLCNLERENSTCVPEFPDFPEVSFSSCIMPRLDSKKYEEYNSTEYQQSLKYESKKYVDAVRNIFLDTLYFIFGVIIMCLLIGACSAIVFKIMKSLGMVRVRYIHVYPTLPPEILEEHGLTPPGNIKDKPKERGSADGINRIEIPEKFKHLKCE